MALTLNRVRDVVLDCLARGEAPSQRVVRKALGGGSPNEIAPLVREVMLELAGRPVEASQLPGTLSGAIEALWQLAQAEANTALEVDRQQAALAVVSWKTQCDDLAAQLATLKQQLADTEKSHAMKLRDATEALTSIDATLCREIATAQSLREQLQQANTAFEQQQSTLAMHEKTIRLEGERTDALEADLAQMRATLEERTLTLAETRGGLKQANESLAELSASLRQEQDRARDLAIAVAEQNSKANHAEQKLAQTTGELEKLNGITSRAEQLEIRCANLERAFAAIAALATIVPTKGRQPPRARVDGVAAQVALAALLGARHSEILEKE